MGEGENRDGWRNSVLFCTDRIPPKVPSIDSHEVNRYFINGLEQMHKDKLPPVIVTF